jgi:hypothetical protein
VEIGSDDDGKPLTSCVIGPAQDEIERAGPGRLPTSQAKFLKVLDDAILHYGGVLPSCVNGPTNTRGVEWTHFARLYAAVSGDRDPETVRKARHRAGEALFAADLIGRDDPWIWLSDKGRRHL